LLRPETADACLESFFDWIGQEPRWHKLLELGQITAEGDFQRFLVDQLCKRGLSTFQLGSYSRALFEPRASADEYLERVLPHKKAKELRRQAKRLAELGPVEYCTLQNKQDLEAWIEEFLLLEASGWKGELRTALASTENDRNFFREILTEAFKRGRLLMLALRLNGKAIAMKCSVVAEPGAFSLKVAFDERYARFSPGVLLEIHNIRNLHQHPEIKWMDSCAIPNHPMINHLWGERRLIQSLVASDGPRGSLLLSILPLLRWAKQRVG
jgi:hypothetical protein